MVSVFKAIFLDKNISQNNIEMAELRAAFCLNWNGMDSIKFKYDLLIYEFVLSMHFIQKPMLK